MVSASTIVKIWCGVVAVSGLIIIGCDVGVNNKENETGIDGVEGTQKNFYGVYSGTFSIIAAVLGFLFIKKKDSGL